MAAEFAMETIVLPSKAPAGSCPKLRLRKKGLAFLPCAAKPSLAFLIPGLESPSQVGPAEEGQTNCAAMDLSSY
jgi:hypothetical protein